MSAVGNTLDRREFSFTETLALAASAIVAIVAALVLVGGWMLGSSLLVRVGPSLAAMVPSTAGCFLLTSLAVLWAIYQRVDSDGTKYSLRVVAAIVAAISAADLVVIATHFAHSIDVLLWPELKIGRDSMSPATALCFLLASAGLALAPERSSKPETAYVVCATVGLLIAMTDLVGYAFDADALYSVFVFTSMAVHTATAFFLIFVALLLMKPGCGWLPLLLGSESGSAGARRLLPLVVLTPFVLGLGALAASRTGLFNQNFSFSLLAIATIVLLVFNVLYNASIQNNVEHALLSTLNSLNGTIAERDLLLREVYHRVKNNLQQISALLHLETSRTTDLRAKAAFRATAGRVHALGTVHRLLISSPSIANLSTARFLEELCESISSSFDAQRQGISIDVNADDMPITIDAAIPLGMLVNEIVTNALKHAFRSRPSGRISVIFSGTPASGAQLVISDNGIGLPERSLEVTKNGTSGSRIIRSFVKQIRGAMHVDTEAGTTITIRIPRGFDQRGSYDREKTGGYR